MQKQANECQYQQTAGILEKLEQVDERIKSGSKRLDKVVGVLNSTMYLQLTMLNNSLVNFPTDETEYEERTEDGVIWKNTPGKEFTQIGSKYYYIERHESCNWHSAVHKCLALGAHLVSLQSQDELDALQPLLDRTRRYWIDINDIGDEGNFLSIVDGLPPTFERWHQKNPSNSKKSEDCGELHSFGDDFLMNDNNCRKSLMYICEYSN